MRRRLGLRQHLDGPNAGPCLEYTYPAICRQVIRPMHQLAARSPVAFPGRPAAGDGCARQGATSGRTEGTHARRARRRALEGPRLLAALLGLTIALFPLLARWVPRSGRVHRRRPVTVVGFGLWWVCTLAARDARVHRDRAARHDGWYPSPSLLKMGMVFPGRAPRRLAVARRAAQRSGPPPTSRGGPHPGSRRRAHRGRREDRGASRPR